MMAKNREVESVKKNNIFDQYAKYFLWSSLLGTLLIPGFIVLLIISSHSTLLINEIAVIISYFFLISNFRCCYFYEKKANYQDTKKNIFWHF